MRYSSDFYKVLNTVISIISVPGGIVPFRKSDGSTGEYTFDDNNDTVRKELMTYKTADDDKDICPEFAQQYYTYDIWTLFCGNDFIHLAIDKSSYCNNESLADLIANEEELSCAEVTQGSNGYPLGLYGVVLLEKSKLSFEQILELADKYGVNVVSLRQKAGWQFWESKGIAEELYDYADYMEEHDDNVEIFDNFQEYADYIREQYKNLLLITMEETEREKMKRTYLQTYCEIQAEEELQDNKFVWVNTHDITRYEIDNRKVSSFNYDSTCYTLALDCRID